MLSTLLIFNVTLTIKHSKLLYWHTFSTTVINIIILKKNILLFGFIIAFYLAKAQTIDSLYFNLYTDSLKKGTYNYINVDAKYNTGKYLPLNSNELIFTSTVGTFERNCLILPLNCTAEKVAITITLKANKSVSKSIYLYIKKKPDNEPLKTPEELIKQMEQKSTTTKRKKGKV